MKKHVVWFNFMLVDYTRDAFIYVMNVCMKKRIEFNAICGKFKGRLEFECDERILGCTSIWLPSLLQLYAYRR